MGDFYSSAWAAIAIVVAYAFAASPLLRIADAPPQAGRPENSIDGLRGFLALAVVLDHAVVYRAYVETGVWKLPPSRIYLSLGELGVAFFFLITAYLFWGQALAGRLEWRKFFVGRLFRIGPLYFAAFAVVFAITLAAAGGLIVPWVTLLKGLVRWSTMGVWGAPDLNGYPNTGHLLAGVTWSLGYEWAFYAALPALILLRRWPLVLSVSGAVISLAALQFSQAAWPSVQACSGLFFLGMVCASAPRVRLNQTLASAGVVALIVVAHFLAGENGPSAGALLACAAAFYLVSCGANLFGLLTTRPAWRLGNISYGIYLLQGLALAAVAPLLRNQSPLGYWMVIIFAILLLLVVAALAHVAIERPGIAAGKALARALDTPRAAPDLSGRR